MYTIETMPNGNVVVTTTTTPQPMALDDFPQAVMETSEYTTLGSYVYRVLPSGRLEQVCEGLLPTGPTLMAGAREHLKSVLRQTLSRRHPQR